MFGCGDKAKLPYSFRQQHVSVSEAGVLGGLHVFIVLYNGWACPRVATGFRMHT